MEKAISYIRWSDGLLLYLKIALSTEGLWPSFDRGYATLKGIGKPRRVYSLKGTLPLTK